MRSRCQRRRFAATANRRCAATLAALDLNGRSRRRATALVFGLALFVGLLVAMVDEVRADDEIQPTQVIAEIPDGYDELFPLQWGGGSLRDLKGRLATMGCLVNTIWVHDGAWHPYNQYNVPSALAAEFLAAYEYHVPAGTLWADCFDHCDYRHVDYTGPAGCETPEEWVSRLDSPPPFECSDFGETIEQWVLPILPVIPSICIVKGFVHEGPTRTYYKGVFYIEGGIPFADLTQGAVFNVHNVADVPEDVELNMLGFLSTTLHELCHAAQELHVAQRLRVDSEWSWHTWDSIDWSLTPAGQHFVQLVGFQRDEHGGWNEVEEFWPIYGHNISPEELAAELCMYYLVLRIPYSALLLEIDRTYTDLSRQRRYVTPEIAAYIEEYFVLPAVTGTAGTAVDEGD